jgi:8-oxo-dGTP pyrophosphatase MutT (NUDIX family)
MAVDAAPAQLSRPLVTVATVVERAGRFLYVEERIRGQLVINQPAGHLDPGESLVEAAIRETLEETAWQVQPEALVAIYQWRNPFDHGDVVRFTFAAAPLRALPGRSLDEGIERALWLDRDELLAQGARLRSPLVLRSLEDYLAGSRVPLTALRTVESIAVRR